MKKVHVYPHTHWDYEWYFTENESIIQLIYHMDEVIRALEEGHLKTYLLDGQISILEEYMKYVPENQSKIQSLIQQKKLLVGPWYTQSDELIISGESIIRNLYYGITKAKQLGYCFPIGYLPDSFGQSQDMPKIYNGFNMKYAIFWRGVSPDTVKDREFYWNCKDESQVLVSHIKNGYYYGGNIIYNDDVESVEKIILDGSKNHLLLPVGGDQRYVDFNLHERIEKYNNETKNNLYYEESDCLTYFQSIENNQFENIQGEFINPSVSKIHHSIYSSRYDHKYLNDRVERRMIYQLEPLILIAKKLGITPKINMLEKIWKKLLLNHAHDSACGCNSDKTNQSIKQRLIEADQLSYSMVDYLTRKISESLESVQNNDIILFNTLAYTRTEPMKVRISTKSKSFSIYDGVDKVDFDIIKQDKINAGSIKRNVDQLDPALDYYESYIYIKTQINALSMKLLKVVEETCSEEKKSKEYIEDDYYCVKYENGKIVLEDKKQGHIIEDFIVIEERSDDGDTYDWSPLENDVIYHYLFENALVDICNGKVHDSMILKGSWVFPKDLDSRINNGLNEEVLYTMKITLLNSGRVDFHLELENTVKDHRMRVIMKTPVNNHYSIADTLFDTIQRENVPEHIEDWRDLGWKEEPTPIYPMLHHVSLKDENTSATAFVKGIKEYEILENRNIALTLFRSVGWLGKPDLLRRPGIASGNEFKYIATPDSQLLQSMKFKFSFMLNSIYDEVIIQRHWEDFAISPLYYQIQEMNRFVNTQKYFVTHPLPYHTSIIDSIVNADCTQNLIITSISCIDESSYYIRLYNPFEKAVEGSIYADGKQVCEVNLLLEKIKDIDIQKGLVKLGYFKPKEIKTFKITL